MLFNFFLRTIIFKNLVSKTFYKSILKILKFSDNLLYIFKHQKVFVKALQ